MGSYPIQVIDFFCLKSGWSRFFVIVNCLFSPPKCSPISDRYPPEPEPQPPREEPAVTLASPQAPARASGILHDCLNLDALLAAELPDDSDDDGSTPVFSFIFFSQCVGCAYAYHTPVVDHGGMHEQHYTHAPEGGKERRGLKSCERHVSKWSLKF